MDSVLLLRLTDIFRMVLFLAMYAVLAAMDLKTKTVPDKVLAACLSMQLCMLAVSKGAAYAVSYLVSGIVMFGIFAMLSIISKGSIGMGDAKLLGVTAATVGALNAVTIFVMGLFISLVVGMALLLFRKCSLKTELPFVPSLAVAAFIKVLLG